MKIHHVAFSVSDISVSIEWYENNLGFKKVNAVDREFGTFALLTNEDGENIELIQHLQSEVLPDKRKDLLTDIKQIGIKHLALKVDNISEALNTLKANGVEQATDVSSAFYNAKYTFIKDPDGNLIELVELQEKS